MRRGSRRQRGTVLLLMAPWIVGFLVFYVYPMLATLYYSFTHFDLLTQPKWVGFSNYRFMFTRDPFFWQSVRNTLWIIVVGVPIQIVFALSVAMVLTRPKRGVGIDALVVHVLVVGSYASTVETPWTSGLTPPTA